MAVQPRHILEQGPVIAGLGRTMLGVVAQQLKGTKSKEKPALPGPVFTETVGARSDSLVDGYIEVTGGKRSAYGSVVPAHMFPQWAFPISGRTLESVPYPLQKVMNGGCRLEINGVIPRGERLRTQAQLVDIDDNGRRAVLKQRIVTGPESDPAALVAYFFPIVPLSGGKKEGGEKAKLEVPAGAREIGRFEASNDAGLEYASVSGDFNPIHWVPAYAKASGFKNTILHGFATMSRAIEILTQTELGGDPMRLRVWDCQFTKPLVLPASAGVYVTDDHQIFVADRPDGSVFLKGSYEVGDKR
jgi:acyl dehydratase